MEKRFPLPERGTATEATQRANAAVTEALPLDDQKDFENARRGLIATIEGGAITDAEGRAVFDAGAYGFLDGPAADTVNPSLWRQAQLNACHGLFEVCDGVYQVRGYDVALMTVI